MKLRMIHSELAVDACRQLVERSADLFLRVRAVLKHGNAIVEMHRQCGDCKFRGH